MTRDEAYNKATTIVFNAVSNGLITEEESECILDDIQLEQCAEGIVAIMLRSVVFCEEQIMIGDNSKWLD